MAGREKAPKAGPEERVTTYLAPGERPNPLAGNEPSISPELEALRDEETAKLAEVQVFKASDREDPSIDPDLVKAREAEIKHGARMVGGVMDEKAAPAEPSSEKAPAKKAAAKKSSK